MQVPKPSRKVDREFLDSFHNRHCIACGTPGCDPAHIRTVKRGGYDEDWNVVPLCRICHNLQGQIGVVQMFKRNIKYQIYLLERGWSLENDRLVNPLCALAK